MAQASLLGPATPSVEVLERRRIVAAQRRSRHKHPSSDRLNPRLRHAQQHGQGIRGRRVHSTCARVGRAAKCAQFSAAANGPTFVPIGTRGAAPRKLQCARDDVIRKAVMLAVCVASG